MKKYLFITLLIFPYFIFSQSKIELAEINSMNLIEKEELKLEHLESSGDYKNIYPITIEGLISNITENRLSISLDFIDQNNISLVLDNLEIYDEDSYFITGTTDPCDHLDAMFMIFSNDNFINGYLLIDSIVFDFYSLNNDKFLLLEHKDNSNNVDNIEIERTNIQNFGNSNNNINIRSLDVIDVLILYNDSAENFCNVEERALSDMNLTNSVFENSGISDIQLNYVIEKIDDYIPEDDAEDAVNNLAIDPYIIERRNFHHADIVVMYVNENFDDNTYGYSSNACDHGNVDSTYVTIVDIGASLKRHTFSHEIYHLFGARHFFGQGICGLESENAHDWEYGLFNTKKRQTIMSIEDLGGIFVGQGKRRIPYLSNPNIQFEGFDTGVEGISENYETINELKHIISNYRGSIIEDYFDVDISGPPNADNGDYVTLNASTIGCPSSSEYSWFKINHDGSSIPLFENSSSLNIQINNNHHLRVKVVATCDGIEKVDHHKVSNNNYEPCPKLSEFVQIDNQIKIFPTITKRLVNVKLLAEFETLIISDLNNQVRKNVNLEGIKESTISIEEFESGIYFLTFQNKFNQYVTKRLIVVEE